MALTEEEARYWRKAHSWDIKDAWALIKKQTDPRRLFEHIDPKLLPKEICIELLEFQKTLEHYNGRLPGYEFFIHQNSAFFGKHPPKTWLEWCDKADIPVPDCLRENRVQPHHQVEDIAGGDSDYISDKLSKMNQAAVKFWRNADPKDRSTHPTNEQVAAWLIEQGFSKTLADKAATLIRPEWAPTGRKPEE